MNFLQKIKDFAANLGTNFLNTALKAVIIAAVCLLIIHIISKMLDKILSRSKLEKAAHGLIKTLAKTVMYILMALIVASSLGIDVTGVVAIASVATLAVSLALQNMFANVIGGFTLLYTHPFSKGDFVDIATQSGTVEEVGIAYTKLITADNKMISIPNSAVVATDIVNYTVTGTRRVDINIGVSYDADGEKVIKTLLELSSHKLVLKDPAPFAALNRYLDSSVEYTLRVWTKSDNYWDVYFELNNKLAPAFKEAGIEMTYPHLNIHLEK